MLRKKIIYRTLGCLLLLPIVCIGVLWIYRFAYTDWGRITGFSPLTEFVIPDTDYTLKIRMEYQVSAHVSLVSPQTNTSEELIIGYHPHVTTIEHNNKTYIILRVEGGGSNGAFDYVVLRLEPRIEEHVQACSNPKLNGSTLEFYDPHVNANYCDWFPFDWQEFPISEIKLD